uniref:Uncharacterized protein n=1 Tax=Opuntia streptacantha TaxID=393608 RepID=A0A7C9ER92_OPUST
MLIKWAHAIVTNVHNATGVKERIMILIPRAMKNDICKHHATILKCYSTIFICNFYHWMEPHVIITRLLPVVPSWFRSRSYMDLLGHSSNVPTNINGTGRTSDQNHNLVLIWLWVTIIVAMNLPPRPMLNTRNISNPWFSIMSNAYNHCIINFFQFPIIITNLPPRANFPHSIRLQSNIVHLSLVTNQLV